MFSNRLRRLRATNLTPQPWRSLRPLNIEAAVTEHWRNTATIWQR